MGFNKNAVVKIGRLSREARKFPESIGGPAGAAVCFFKAIQV
jgi:hypothetical protein